MTDISEEDFIAALKKAYKEKYVEKQDNRLISPAFFDETLSDENNRGLDNVVFTRGLWLDIDKGHMSHKDFSYLFPYQRIVAYSSFSSTKEQPRYRIYLPTSRIMSVEEYASIVGQIIQVVKDAGYPLAKKDDGKPHQKSHGIDLSKRHAAALFYLPCQPKDPKGAIWKDYRGGARKPLDVDDWLAHSVPVETGYMTVPAAEFPTSRQDADEMRRDRAITHWKEVGTLRGNGDAQMFRLARELEYARVPFFEARAILLEAAQEATSPADRKLQAERILRERQRHWPT